LYFSHCFLYSFFSLSHLIYAMPEIIVTGTRT
jgi:hypothetical protein